MILVEVSFFIFGDENSNHVDFKNKKKIYFILLDFHSNSEQ